MTFLNTIESVIGSHHFVLIAILASFLLKLLIIIFTMNQPVNSQKAQRLRFLLLVILGANMFSDITWIQELLINMGILNINPYIYFFTGRISWGFFGVQWQGLALFLEGLVTRQYKLTIRQKISCIITALFVLVPIGSAFIYYNHPEKIPLTVIINNIAVLYCMLFLLPYSLFVVLRKLRTESLPQILIKQLNVIIYCLIIPHFFSDIMQVFPIGFRLPAPDWITNSYSMVALSAIFLTIRLFYCARKVMGLRFLNIRDQVDALPKANFIANFKIILDQLDQVANTRELGLITQNFFKEALSIPIKKTKLYLRPFEDSYQPQEHHYNTNKTVETFVNTSEPEINNVMKKKEVLIYDEINFSHFYDQSIEHKKLLTFLTDINADIFLPIYDKNNLLAYIIIERSARKKELYNSAEQSEMIMFGGYLQKTICLLYKQSIEMLIEQNTQLTQNQEILKKELHLRHQEMNQHREGLQPFLYRDLNQIGLIFYKKQSLYFW